MVVRPRNQYPKKQRPKWALFAFINEKRSWGKGKASVMLKSMAETRPRTRSANHRDLQQIAELYRHLHPEDPEPDRAALDASFGRFQAYQGSAIFIAEMDSAIVASCTLVVVPNLTRGVRPYGLIENVVTHPDFRNRGLGKAILQAATEAAWQAACYKVMLMTGATTSGVLDFYRAAGFEQSKTAFQIRHPEGA